MADNYDPGVYVKGDQTRVADTRRDAVQAVFDGFTKVESPAESNEDHASYRDLQEQAKELGIPANQSAEVLEAEIAKALEDS